MCFCTTGCRNPLQMLSSLFHCPVSTTVNLLVSLGVLQAGSVLCRNISLARFLNIRVCLHCPAFLGICNLWIVNYAVAVMQKPNSLINVIFGGGGFLWTISPGGHDMMTLLLILQKIIHQCVSSFRTEILKSSCCQNTYCEFGCLLLTCLCTCNII